MTTIYMQLKIANAAYETKRAVTRKLDLGRYITASDDELTHELAVMSDNTLKPSEHVICTYIGSIKQWDSKGITL